MRTFVAIELPLKIKEEVEKAIAPFKKLNLDISWVKTANLHLTMRFLGEVDEKRIEDIITALEKALEEKEGFELDFESFGVFPDFRRPRVVWIGIEKGKENLIGLQRIIEQELSKLDFPEEKRGFSPHLTIGRVKSPKGIERLTEQIKSVNFKTCPIQVGEVVLMKSQLHPQGAIYTPLEKFKLK